MKKTFLLAFLLISTTIFSQSMPSGYIARDSNNILYVYIDNPIRERIYYRDLFMILKSANENDKIVIVVNCAGGVASTGVAMYNAIKECKADITVEVVMAHSAASFIVVAAKNVKIKTGAYMILHTLQLSGNVNGSVKEINNTMEMLNTWTRKFYYEIYKDFLTCEEISNILDGKEVVLYEDELRKRLEK